MTRIRLLLAVLLAAAVAGGGPVGAQAARPAAGAAVQVTSNPNPVRNHSTPQIARNPRTGELVIVESDPRSADRRCNIHISADGGRSWRPGGDPMPKDETDCAIYAEYGPYASLAFGRDGTLYVAFVASEQLGRARNATPRSVFLARSDDSGRTFTTATVFKAPDGNEDRGLNKGAMLAVDPKNPAKVYVGWRQGIFAPNATEKLKSNIAPSADGGRTFGPPVDLTDDRGGDYPGIAVSGDGVVHAVYWTRTGIASQPAQNPPPVRPIQYVSSTDGGRTYSRPVPIDPGNQRADRPPLLAADPRTPNLYMVWYGHADPNNSAPGFRGDLDIFFRASHDGGRSWDDRKVLNDDGPGTAHQIDPGISVAPNGRIDVAWYDGRSSAVPVDPSSPDVKGFQDVYYTSSEDHGRSFGPNVMISDRAIDRSIGIFSNNVSSHHNIGIVSTDDQVWVAWQDSRNGSSLTHAEDVYAATVDLDGTIVAGSAGGTEWGASPGAIAAAALLGMGVAMVGLWFTFRRSTGRTPAPG
jgi:hypothetical protein